MAKKMQMYNMNDITMLGRKVTHGNTIAMYYNEFAGAMSRYPFNMNYYDVETLAAYFHIEALPIQIM